MSWAKFAKEKLAAGEQVTIRPRGHSMRGKVDDGDLVTLVPAADITLEVGDIVLVRVSGTDYLHLIKAISE
jgi:SOS-response transcriptional repressor LexA